MKPFSIILTILLIFTALIDFRPGGGYYTLLRCLVTFGAVLWMMQYYNKSQGLFITFSVIAIVFNPVIPIYLGREIWQVVDFIVGAIFVLSLIIKTENK